MVFNSVAFLFFFALVMVFHYSPLPWTAKKVLLVSMSYLFYASWYPPLALLLAFSTIVDGWIARRMGAISEQRGRRRWLTLSVAANLGLLSFFKYSNFALENVESLLRLASVDTTLPRIDVPLPVGISFFTFQALSYTIDVYRGKLAPVRTLLDFGFLIAFFPHFVSGPIVRAGDLLPQLHTPKRLNARAIGWGMALFTVGLLEKDLADHLLAPAVDIVYAPGAQPGLVDAWLGTLAFAGQIFFDFAGYSTCAIGTALALGFILLDNFRFPYAARGFSDFWRRWHISLSEWLRDYLYVPLGGNRGTPSRVHANLMATMLLGGLWHGASWTFVVWGALHGGFLVVERFLRVRLGNGTPASAMLGQAVTFCMVCFAWVFFRARSFADAWTIVRAMLGLSPSADALLSPAIAAPVVGLTVALLAGHHLMRSRGFEWLVAKLPWWGRSVLLAIVLVFTVVLSGEDRAFIYFQF